MAVNYIEFAQDVLADATALDGGFQSRARNLIANFNVVPNVPDIPAPSSVPYFDGGRFKGGAFSNAIGTTLTRKTGFADVDSNAYDGAVKTASGFFDKWFGTPTTDQLLGNALTTLENSTVAGLMDDYIALNVEEAKEIRVQAQLQYQRDEEELLLEAGRRNNPKMSGATFRAIALLRERMHEKIRDELRKLGGEGLQREFSLVTGVIAEKLKLNQDAKQSMAEWISRVDTPLYGAQKEYDDILARGRATSQENLLALSQRFLDLDRRGLSLASTYLGATRDAVLGPIGAARDRNKLQLDYLISDLQAVSTHLAGTYNKLRAGYRLSWDSSSTQRIVHEDPNA